MTITARLASLIGGAILALLVVGAIGLVQLGRLNASVRQVTEQEVPALEAIKGFESRYHELRTLVFRHIADPDLQRKSAIDAELKTKVGALDQDVQRFEARLEDPAAKARVAEFRKTVAAYFLVCETALTRSRQNQTEAAMELAVSPFIEDAAVLSDEILGALAKEAGDRVASTREASASTYKTAFGVLAALIVVAMAAMVVLGWLLAASITRPLTSLRNTVVEIGSSLDFTRRIPSRGRDEIGQTVAAFNTMVESVQASFAELAQSAGRVGEAARGMQHTSQQLAQSAGVQADSASAMAAAVEEVTVSINHVADRAQEAATLSADASRSAGSGAQVVGATVQRFSTIATEVDQTAASLDALQSETARISSVVGVIREVAEQTNLLALNAAIEAARAGEQGRGFAVVADEVRGLAERTAKSTSEITQLVGRIQSGAQQVVQRMQQTVATVKEGASEAVAAGEAIHTIKGSSDQAVDMVSDITDSIREQSAASNAIAQQVERIATMTEESTASARHTASAASDLNALAEKMVGAISRYRY
ncbi:methyl-accepting chemotaxis protein [Niveibacterium umoris]|uniref:Methyl-accepting chemotaxis protein n=1 Tax=Niveibacterium umoris TaxID=1193620 RepID=A0A840BGM4_9RHOO|nr:methyl-accepting chemotaxis protein [Niveibacterium umoris]MBB4011823.1 methyl-accepting chemotaxis protein [Niveibacterium umoris]